MSNKCFSTLGCHDRSLGEIISLARKYRMEKIELRGISGEMNTANIPELSEENISKTRKMLADEGISVVSVNSSAKFDNPNTVEENMSEALEAARVAYQLGAQYVRVFGNRVRNESTVENVIACLDSLSSHMPSGVSLLLEVHGDFNTLETLVPICRRLEKRESFGLLYDVAHADRVYGDRFKEFLSPLLPMIKHVHIKDHKRADSPVLCQIGEGDIPISEIAEFLISNGYRGAISLEWERAWHKDLGKIEEALDAFTKIV